MDGVFMIPFLRLPYRSMGEDVSRRVLPQWAVVLVLLLILLLQLGLLLMMA